jgi:hypothetical protein
VRSAISYGSHAAALTGAMDAAGQPPIAQRSRRLQTPRSYNAGITAPLAVLPEIPVEHHRNVAHEQPSFRRNSDCFIAKLDEAELVEFAQVLEFRFEVLIEIDQIGGRKRFFE